MRKILDPIAQFVKRERNEKIYAAIVQAGSIRKLAKEIGLGEATIRDVLKERRKKVQENTVIGAIDKYYRKKADRTKEFNQIKTQIHKLPPANQRQIAVKGKFYKYTGKNELTGKSEGKYISFKGDTRKRVMLAHGEIDKKTKEVKLTQKDIAILEQISNYDIVRFK